ncbi:hypothetical protein KDK95_09765 [Actinospica sp. MGRD01-02]|uniref:Alpha-L-rhamnosidase n=1 Tax=Actinospica acidithermotolerans TaxID=2828514 RepID=A0A941IFQ2_9ACTN|nr:glycosyl hydrolase [Actinospica acidithermotolerans]MBR7826590.1 hypothetical protein [Actinospica acidithermotolerans]
MSKRKPRSSAPAGEDFPTRGKPGAGVEFTRRRLLALTAAAGAGALLPLRTAASASADGSTPGFPAAVSRAWRSNFAAPPTSVAPKFRWWWPNGQVDPAEIAREVDQVADIGFGGLELSDIHASGLDTLDIVNYPWGGSAWVEALEAALTRAKARGLSVDLTLGPGYPVCAPTVGPDSPAASTELAHGVVTVAGGATYSGVVPAAVVAAGSGVTKQTLYKVQALRVTGAAVSGVTPLDQSSLIDVTDSVSDGQISWTAPAGSSNWVLLSYWLRGVGQLPKGGGPFEVPTAYVVDHFSAIGTKAVTDWWDDSILNPRLEALLRQVGIAFFEDSLELSTVATIWTSGLPDAFRQSLGYDLVPYLPVIVSIKGKFQFAYDATLSAHVRDDVNSVMSSLYQENHLLGFQNWAHGHGMQYRMQPYGLNTDSLFFASFLDIPEGETLGFKNLDDYRVLCGGRDLAGHLKLSCEALAYANGAYSTTWYTGLQAVGSYFAAGVNQSVVHGFAYSNAPGATWPGFAAWSPYQTTGIGYSEAWGPRQPTWGHMPDIAGYFSRNQWVLQSGTPKYDIVFYRQKGYTATGIGAPWATASGIPTGWTHSFATDRTLELPGVSVVGGRLATDGPSYGALILGPDQFTGSETEISPDGARLLLGFAKAGLPTVVLGDWSKPLATGVVSAGDSAQVAADIAQMLSLPNVVSVSDQSLIPNALAQLGVVPAVTQTSSSLMHSHRVDGHVDLYYLANARHAASSKITAINQTVWLTPVDPDAVPYRLNAWTGAAARIAQFTVQDGRIGVQVALNPGESTIVVLAKPGWAGEHGAVQVTATSADSVSLGGDGTQVLTRAAQAGSYTATLADGTVLNSTIGAVPAPIPLTSWSLSAEDWQPAPGSTDVTATVKPVVRVDLTALAAWSAIPQLQDSSGVGRYTTQFTLPSTWNSGLGATLSLGTVLDTYRVWVNGTRVPPARQLAASMDLGPLLKAGQNTIVVEVATTLLNRLRVVTPGIYGIASRQAYGLIGPVTLTPYGQAAAS